jgi:hypothetical protein
LPFSLKWLESDDFMQRRQFILLTAMGGAAVGITGISCGHYHPALYDILSEPSTLAQICDLKTIKEIGMTYRLQRPSEKDADKLVSLLLTDTTGKPVSSDADKSSIQTLLHNKMNHDFENDNTVIVKGWILSVTEARQCALQFVDNP